MNTWTFDTWLLVAVLACSFGGAALCGWLEFKCRRLRREKR